MHKLLTIQKQTDSSQPPYIITTPTTYPTTNPIFSFISYPTLGDVSNSNDSTHQPYASLQPTYRAQQKSEQQKLLLRVNKFGLFDKELMQELYQLVASLINPEKLKNKCTQKFILNINTCIDRCNKVKQLYGINEDHLGRFAFNQHKDGSVALFYSSLKHYNRAIYLNNEKMYLNFEEPSDFAKALGLTADMIEDPLLISVAMKHLVNDMFQIKDEEDATVRRLARLLYTNKKPQQENDAEFVLEQEWEKSFARSAFGYLGLPGAECGLDSMIKKLECAQKAGKLCNDRGLVNFILTYEPTFLERCNMAPPLVVSYTGKKSKMSLLSVFVARYNNARGSKINPLLKNMHSYLLAKKLHIAVPEGFDDKLLDPQYIAIQEKINLCVYVENLIDSSSESIEKYACALNSPQSENYESLLESSSSF